MRSKAEENMQGKVTYNMARRTSPSSCIVKEPLGCFIRSRKDLSAFLSMLSSAERVPMVTSVLTAAYVGAR